MRSHFLATKRYCIDSQQTLAALTTFSQAHGEYLAHLTVTYRGCVVMTFMFGCRIVVSAPNGTASGSANAEPHTGVLYVCSVEQAPNGECVPLMGDGTGPDNRLYDTQGTSRVCD